MNGHAVNQAALSGPAPAYEFTPCPHRGCQWGKGHIVEHSNVRRCWRCDEPVGERHRPECTLAEPNDAVEEFDCLGDA